MKSMSKGKKELLKKVFIPLTWLNRLVPKKEDQIFFYANLGFRDNVRAMYDYCLEQRLNLHYHMVCAVPEWKEMGKTAPENVEFLPPERGMWKFLRSACVFYSFGKYPVKPGRNQKVVNLWHGVPLKRIGNMEPENAHVDYNYFTHLLVTSPYYVPIMRRCFRCSKEQILLCGQPRNDALFRKDTEQEAAIRSSQKKLILWLPTYRTMEKEGKGETWPVPLVTREELEELNVWLCQQDCRMIIKLHPLQYYDRLWQYSHIRMLDQAMLEAEFGNLYALLKLADGLVTDYSSIFFDYILLDRPMAFTVEDMESYGADRGFVMKNPLDFMAGEKIHNYQELTVFLEDVAEGRDPYAARRRKINDLVNAYQDGENSERIAQKCIPHVESVLAGLREETH